MHRISTNATLFLKLFLPIFWFVFFGAFVLTVWFVKTVSWGILHDPSAKVALTLLYIIFIVFTYLTLWRLKRVEVDDLFLYVYSYFKSVRYPYPMIEDIRQYSFGPFQLACVRLKMDGSFGKKIWFFESKGRVRRQREAIPALDALYS